MDSWQPSADSTNPVLRAAQAYFNALSMTVATAYAEHQPLYHAGDCQLCKMFEDLKLKREAYAKIAKAST